MVYIFVCGTSGLKNYIVKIDIKNFFLSLSLAPIVRNVPQSICHLSKRRQKIEKRNETETETEILESAASRTNQTERQQQQWQWQQLWVLLGHRGLIRFH